MIVWAILLGFGAFGYVRVSKALRHDMFAFIEFIAPFPTVLFVAFGPTTLKGNLWKKLLLWLIPFASALFMFTIVVRSEVKLMRYPTPELTQKFGLCSVAFFACIFAWTLITPPRGSGETNFKWRKLRLAIPVAVGLLQALFAVQFLREIWVATSIDQVRFSVRLLLYTGLALYFLLLAMIFLPRIASHEDVAGTTGA
jgi:hypothetical protein